MKNKMSQQLMNLYLLKHKNYLETLGHKMKWRIIKIHGGLFQEAGLPDLLILIKITKGRKEKTYVLWLEAKRNWKDNPTPLQMHNIEKSLNEYVITGYITLDQYKRNWKNKQSMKILNLLSEVLK